MGTVPGRRRARRRPTAGRVPVHPAIEADLANAVDAVDSAVRDWWTDRRAAREPPMTGQIRPSPDDERALAERFRRGDELALREVYDLYGGLIHRLGVSCLASHHDAEDVTQATFVAAWRGRETYDPNRGTLAGWLLGIARRQVVDRLRALRREHGVAAAVRQAGTGYSQEPAPERAVDRL